MIVLTWHHHSLSVAISQVFGTALAGHCKDLPDRVDEAMPFEVNIAVLPCRGGETSASAAV